VRLLVVGGRLQGTEAVYLARKAGFETLLVDRAPSTPASGLADEHVVLDVTANESRSKALAGRCDALLPACEDLETLAWLTARAPEWGLPLLFDLAAYRVTRSKSASWRLFDELGVARPQPWPAAGFPAIVKPDGASGSQGVTLVNDEEELAAARATLAAAGHRPIVEAYVDGPSLSLEVLAWNGVTLPLQVTGLEFDAVYDCKRVVAPVGVRRGGGGGRRPAPGRETGRDRDGGGEESDWDGLLEPGVLANFAATAECLAGGLDLRGVMDVEVLLRDGREPLVLEVDARLPSQTPTVVYWSSGANLVELLAETARRGAPPAFAAAPRRACVYQHVRAASGRLEVVGEHALAVAGPLRRVEGLAGADEALTDRDPSSRIWVATLVTTGASLAEARARGTAAVAALAAESDLEVAPDLGPGTPAERAAQ
jgi:pyrrolysine biosynthesis protein PylC